MAYDAAIHEIVLFGGSSTGEGTPLADTWTHNGVTWIERAPATSPPPREGAAMAYDPATGRVVLFGGAIDNDGEICVVEQYGDTWTYDGVTWTELTLPKSPTPRAYTSMAFDPATGAMVLSGGLYALSAGLGGPCNQSTVLNDTSGYDGTSWSVQTPDVSPPARQFASMAFNSSTGDMVLFGGESETYSFLADTWKYGPVGSGYWFAAADGGVFAF